MMDQFVVCMVLLLMAFGLWVTCIIGAKARFSNHGRAMLIVGYLWWLAPLIPFVIVGIYVGQGRVVEALLALILSIIVGAVTGYWWGRWRMLDSFELASVFAVMAMLISAPFIAIFILQ